jgi:O-antigen ligase
MNHADTAHLAAVLGALGAVLVLVPRHRFAVLAGLALVVAAEVGLALAGSGGLHLGRLASPAKLAVVVLGLAALGAIAAFFVRSPGWAIPFLLAAAPFRLPLDVNTHHRFFFAVAPQGELGRLLPLYVVLAATTTALAYRLVRGEEPRALPLQVSVPAGAFLALASLSLLWTEDLTKGRGLLAFFLLPFAVLVAVVARAPFERWLPRVLAIVAIALACLFALVGLIEEATHHVFFFASNLEVGNAYASFFRVTSLFRDPSLYGRHLVLGIAVLLVILWLRRIELWLAALLIGLIWAGLFFSYSQSSMAALFLVTLAITAIAGDRGAKRLVIVAAVAVGLAGVGYVTAAAVQHSARRATSDRSRRVTQTAGVYAAHPIYGVGLGAQPKATQKRAKRYAPEARFVSHTTPLTVAAELGTIGLLAYLALLAGALRVIEAVRRRDQALGLTLGAALLALFVHALFYSGFFEDPITWFVLGLAASFLAAQPAEATEPAAKIGSRRQAVAVTK